ncbi:hypothetical protein [Oculatella sp. FACHB-28]|nr:hypothetical protein [Oculatella sp. FACHB-28]
MSQSTRYSLLTISTATAISTAFTVSKEFFPGRSPLAWERR